MFGCIQQLYVKRDTKDKQLRQQKENPLYEMLDLKKEGCLLRIFEQSGHAGVLEYCDQNLPNKFLYTAEDHMIRKDEYVEWRRAFDKDLTKSKLNMSEDDDDDDLEIDWDILDYPNHEFKDHGGCWDLHFRGGAGESLLHLCFLNDTPVHIEIAKVLLEWKPRMVLDIYEAEEYYGESALHFAVVHGDMESVKLLVEKGANINQRATGRFFLPEDQKLVRSENTNYEGYAYYGEYPLAFAVCCGFESIYDYLLNHGADPNLQDSFGNTVLHMAVVKNQPEMYAYALRHRNKAYPFIENWFKGKGQGLTPLQLASYLGRQDMFNKINELQRRELWTFSNVQCSQYPLYQLDSIQSDGTSCSKSALLLAVNGSSPDHMEMCQSGVIRQLIEFKWTCYVKKHFIIRLGVLLLQLLTVFIAVAARPTTDITLLRSDEQTTDFNERIVDYTRFTCEILAIMLSLLGICMSFYEMYSLGFRFYFVNLGRTPYRLLYVIGCILLVICFPIRLAAIFTDENRLTRSVSGETITYRHSLKLAEESLLCIAIPLLWCMPLFFAKVHHYVGPLINMLLEFFLRDLRPILIIAFFWFISFGAAFHFLYKSAEIIENKIEAFLTPWGSVMTLIHYMFGEFEYDEFILTKLPPLTMIIFVVFMMGVPILLLNMLLAKMNKTFGNVINISEKQAIQNWSRIVLALEKSITAAELKQGRKKYIVEIDSRPDESDELGHNIARDGAIQMIKLNPKSKSKQRRSAKLNWKPEDGIDDDVVGKTDEADIDQD